MANMSEEWRQSIVEGDNYDKNRKRAAQRAAERNAARDSWTRLVMFLVWVM
jgi:hypothetical protein